MASEPIEILIVGLGALGTIYGYILSQNENVRVTAIARSSYDAMQKNGVNIESEKFGNTNWRPHRLVRTAEEANDRSYHYIVCTFKCLPDLVPSASVLAPFLESEHAEKYTPTVVLIQNGLGIEHPVQVAYPHVPIVSVVAWIGANLLPGPRVTHGLLEKLIIGLYTGEGVNSAANPGTGEVEDDLGDPAGYKQGGEGEERKEEGVRRTNQFAHLLQSGGGGVEVMEDIQPSRYSKLLWNAAWSSICTLSRSTVSAVVAPEVLPFTLPVVRRTMLEVLYVARAWGYDEAALPMKSIDEAIKISIKNYQRSSGNATPATPGVRADAFGSQGYGFPTDGEVLDSVTGFKPSMLLDVEAGRPSELEPIIGSVLDRARARGVATPRLDLVYASLKIHQDAAVRRMADTPEHKAAIETWLQRRPAVAGAGVEGRKAWEKALRMGVSEVKVSMAGGKPKVRGKPVAVTDENEEQ